MHHRLDDLKVDFLERYPSLLSRRDDLWYRGIPSRTFLKIAYSLPRREGTWMNSIAQLHDYKRKNKQPIVPPQATAEENTTRNLTARELRRQARAKKGGA